MPKFQLPPLSNEETFQDFICDLYNHLYKTSTFQRFGKKGHKQKGIDIISIPEGIAIQCKKKERTRRGAIRELKNDFQKDVQSVKNFKSKIKILIFASTLTDSADLSECLQEIKEDNKLEFDLVYLGWETLSDHAINYPYLLEKYFREYLPKKANILSPILFFDNNALLGREKLLSAVEKHCQNNPLLVLQGVGGIGKTALLSCYVNNNIEKYDNIIWLESQSESILNDAISQFSLGLNLKYDGSNIRQKWKSILTILGNIQGRNLILIDGIEEIDNTVFDTIEDLCSTRWQVIATSRVKLSDYFTLNITGLSRQSSRELFTRFYKHNDYDEKKLTSILIKLEYHPLLIELLAKAANANPRITLGKLYTLMNEDKFQDPQLQNIIHVGMHAKNLGLSRYQRIFKYLLLCFKVNTLTSSEKTQLTYFSILPPSTPIDFSWYMDITGQTKQSSPKIIDSLNCLDYKGWIIKRQDKFYIHPLIQIVTRKKFNTNSKKIEPVILKCTKKLSKIEDEGSWKLNIYISIARNILNTISIDVRTLFLSQFFATALTKIGDYKRAIVHYEECIKYLQDHNVFNPGMYSSFLNNLGNAYAYIGKYDEALACLSKSIELARHLDDGSAISLGRSLDNFANVLEKLGRYNEALALTKNAIKLFKDHNAEKELALAYTNLGNTYCQLKDYRKALHY
jgi:hypothetical protein